MQNFDMMQAPDMLFAAAGQALMGGGWDQNQQQPFNMMYGNGGFDQNGNPV